MDAGGEKRRGRLDYFLFVSRLFWGSVCWVTALPWLLLAVALQSESSIEYCLCAGLAFAAGAAEGLAHRTFKASAKWALVAALTAPLYLLVFRHWFHSDFWLFFAAVLGMGDGVGLTIWRGEKKAGLALGAAVAGVACATVFLLILSWQFPQPPWSLLGVLAGAPFSAGVGLVVMLAAPRVEHEPKRRWQFSLGLALLMYLLVAAEMGVGVGIWRADQQHFQAAASKAREWLRNHTGLEPLDPSVSDAVRLAAQLGLPLSELESVFGPATPDRNNPENFFYWNLRSGEGPQRIGVLVVDGRVRIAYFAGASWFSADPEGGTPAKLVHLVMWVAASLFANGLVVLAWSRERKAAEKAA